MKKVLVTGGTGFVGRHVLPLLPGRGFEVHALGRGSGQDRNPEAIWHEADLMNPNGVEKVLETVKPSHLLHLAWTAAPGGYRTSPENIRWVRASLSLMESFSGIGGRRMVMAGTCAEYGGGHDYCSEDRSGCSPETLYGASKEALQILVGAYSRKAGLSSAWGRIFYPYGPYEHPDRLIPFVIRSLLHHQTAQCSPGERIRDLIFIQDVAEAFALMLDSDVSGPLNIGTGLPIKLKDVVLKIGQKMGRPDLIRAADRPSAVGDEPRLVADVSRISKELGWAPKYDLDRGLDKAIEWWTSRESATTKR